MARARNIKPGFFKNEVLAELSPEIRLLFIGLWTLADREGRLEDRPKRIRAELFAFDGFDVDSMLTDLQSNEFLTRYEIGGTRYIQIENFVKHQDPHYKEKASEIPPPAGCSNLVVATGVTRTQRARILERDGYVCQHCGSKEHLCIDHVLPVSRGGDSADDNLQVLCLSCNTKKGNKLDGELKNTSRKGSDQLPDPDDIEQISMSTRRRSVGIASVPLIPDSLSTDSLIPDSPLPTPAAAPRGELFEEFWKAYPKKRAKDDAKKAFDKRKPDRQLLDAMLEAITVQSKTEDWVKDAGKFIPYPATWLNDGRWMDVDGIELVQTERGPDPALQKILADDKKAAPMPENLRRQFSEITRRMSA